MLIIINDDGAYVSWIGRHRRGFVADYRRQAKRHPSILHRATCSIVKPHKRARLTTGAHIKACSLARDELETWVEEQTGAGLTPCPECQPDADEAAVQEQQEQQALTRLERDALSYILDLAVIFLDGEDRFYHPRVEGIAAYVDKSTAQVAPALERLIDKGYLVCDAPKSRGKLASRTVLYPTAQALRTIPAFEEMSDKDVAAELANLRGDESGGPGRVS